MKEENIEVLFRKNGYRVTPQRLAISKLILSSRNHPNVDEIYDKISKQFPTISLSTVYQTLNVLKLLGKIFEIKNSDKGSRFETNLEPHVNIICLKCGLIEDYSSPLIKNFLKNLKKELEFEPDGFNLEIYRTCDSCKEKNKNK